MLKIGSFISSLFNKSEVIIIAHQNNYREQIKQAFNLSKNFPELTYNCIINFEGEYTIDNQSQIIQNKPKNLNLIFHPSNRKIENHLLLLQFITKIKKSKNYIIINPYSKNNFLNCQLSHHIKRLKVGDKDAIKIHSKELIDLCLNGNALENLRLMLN